MKTLVINGRTVQYRRTADGTLSIRIEVEKDAKQCESEMQILRDKIVKYLKDEGFLDNSGMEPACGT